MEIKETFMKGLYVVQPNVFGDERGYFMETYSQAKWGNIENPPTFVQDNESKSKKGVLRGLHFQAPPFAQDKLVRVIKGAVLDVAVDIRKNSPTYGQHYAIELSERNKTQFYVPKGFAHGFISLEDDTIFTYKVSALYAPESEACLLWNSKELSIDWKIDKPSLSAKDLQGIPFSEFKSPF